MRYLVGVGNYSMGDDSVGLRLVEAIADRGLDIKHGFGLAEIGHDGLRLLDYCREDVELLVLMDCVNMGRTPGESLVFAPSDVVSQKRVAGYSTHEGDMLKTLELAPSLGHTVPPVKILGIQTESMTPVMELSAPLQRRFEEYLQQAVKLVSGPV